MKNFGIMINWLCPNDDGHADHGAECSESNGKNNKKILRFLFFELSSRNWGNYFQKNYTEMAKT